VISIGIDVSKDKSMACIVSPQDNVMVKPYEIAHTDKELERLCSYILSLDKEARVVLEATGAYHLPVVLKLKEHNIFVSIINPLLMKKYSSIKIRKGKTDKIDALKITSYGIDNWFHLVDYTCSKDVYDELRFLGRQYSHYVKVKIQAKLSLSNILDRTMPRITSLLTSHNTAKLLKNKLLDFVEEYLHYDNILALGEDSFIESYNRWAKEKGYRASDRKAKTIFSLASIGIPTLSSSLSSTKMLTLENVRVMKEINKTLDIILSQMQELANVLPEYDVVRQMSGVGEVLSVRLIAEIGDVRRFKNGSSLVAYAGLDSPPYESGQFIATKRSISKRGSSLLRKTGYEVIQCIKSTKPTEDSAVYDFVMKKQNEGKPRMVANIAGLNKFLRIYYARVKEVYSVV